MSHHHDTHDLTHLYEGDQSKLYSGVLAHHEDINSDESRAKVKRIWKVTGILTLITIIEVFAGLMLYTSNANVPHVLIITFFVAFTLLKAYYIVKVFMHLGDETKVFAKFVLFPMLLVVWLAVVLLVDSTYHLGIGETFGHTVKAIVGGH
ncbi:cytochrome C oxidase subunit IV family protein [Edaphocola aurantiacus]|uniref:cytochrome C oxidase subunit IV family protein n=1 Tax=Edaphocola aurantiacus TaxID=2601682 RepID=UPI001C96D13F|nr:cytochrome C oxidase subunit IV family protein [Edaphocola aurantiacus]